MVNQTQAEQPAFAPKILYSALINDTIVGEVLNNFSYPIELVRITVIHWIQFGLIVQKRVYNLV